MYLFSLRMPYMVVSDHIHNDIPNTQRVRVGGWEGGRERERGGWEGGREGQNETGGRGRVGRRKGEGRWREGGWKRLFRNSTVHKTWDVTVSSGLVAFQL